MDDDERRERALAGLFLAAQQSFGADIEAAIAQNLHKYLD